MFGKLYKSITIAVFALMITVLPFVQASAQDGDLDLEQTLQQLSDVAARNYVRPVSDAMGVNLNGGWFHRVPQAKILGFDLGLSVVAMGTFLDDEAKTFSESAPWHFTRDQAEDLVSNLNPAVQDAVIDEILSNDFTVTIAGPTAIGTDDDNISVTFSGAAVLGETIPSEIFELEDIKGLARDLDIISLGVPQLSVGTVLGTMATFRWLPEIEIDKNIGPVKYFGFGIQHNFQSWIATPLPVEVSLGYFTQKFEIGDIIDITTNSFGLTLSKHIGDLFFNLVPYAGYMFESSETDVRYDFDVDTPTGTETQNIAFTLDGINENRTTVGLSLQLVILNINADYNFGERNSVTAGLMIAF